MVGRSDVEGTRDRGGPEDRVRALIGRGELERAEDAIVEVAVGPGRAALAAVIAWARGELLPSLQALERTAPGAVVDRALVLGTLGRFDEGLSLLAGRDDGPAALRRAWLHIEAGDTGPAAVALAAAAEAAVMDDLDPVERALLDAEMAILDRDPAKALARLRTARRLGARRGQPGALARAWARTGIAHADLGHRWRALRAVTHALDLAAGGGVARPWLPGLHLRAFQVYGMFGHRERAEAALETGHHLVIQIASGIEDRAYRETFLIDNRDCQQVVGLWKGERDWGRNLPWRDGTD